MENPASNFYLLSDEFVHQINEACYRINDWAEKKGWNEGEDSVQRKSSDIALMHSELSECLEFVRKKVERVCYSCGAKPTAEDQDRCICAGHFKLQAPSDDHVPSLTGEAAELADVIIRILHYCGRRSIDLGAALQAKHAYNCNRPYRHGKAI